MKTNNQQFELHLIGQLLPKDYTYAIGCHFLKKNLIGSNLKLVLHLGCP